MRINQKLKKNWRLLLFFVIVYFMFIMINIPI